MMGGRYGVPAGAAVTNGSFDWNVVGASRRNGGQAGPPANDGHEDGPEMLYVAAAARQRSMRVRVRSRPSSSRLSKIGGLTVPPLTATRIGWATFPRPRPFCSQ